MAVYAILFALLAGAANPFQSGTNALPARLLGCGLLVGGVWLISRF